MAHERILTAPQTGPISLDFALLGAHGLVTVRTDTAATAATVAIRTYDHTGPCADAVREARLHWDARGALVAHVEGNTTPANTMAATVTGGIQFTGTNHSVITQAHSGGVYISDIPQPAGIDCFPVEIAAVVPEGTSLMVRTHNADILASGLLGCVTATTESGDISVPDRVEQVIASTQSGAISVYDSPCVHLKSESGEIGLSRTDIAEATSASGDITIADFGGTAQLQSASGDITVYASVGGDISAVTTSGAITVTAKDAAQAEGLEVSARSITGAIRIPARRTADSLRRRTS